MKQALVDGRLVKANPDATPKATCPACDHPVDLRRRLDTWFWRHQAGAPRDCPARSGDWVPPQREDRVKANRPTAEQVAELVDLARRIGAQVVSLDAGQVLEVTGPGTIIVTGEAASSGG